LGAFRSKRARTVRIHSDRFRSRCVRKTKVQALNLTDALETHCYGFAEHRYGLEYEDPAAIPLIDLSSPVASVSPQVQHDAARCKGIVVSERLLALLPIPPANPDRLRVSEDVQIPIVLCAITRPSEAPRDKMSRTRAGPVHPGLFSKRKL